MRSILSLQLLATFVCFAASLPATSLRHGSLATTVHQTLLDTVLGLTNPRLDLRDAALAILEGPVSRRSEGKEQLDKRSRWSLYFPKPRPQGIQPRDDLSQISQLLAQLEESFVELAQLISEQLDIPIPTPPLPPHRCTTTAATSSSTTATPSSQPDRHITTSLQPLTTIQALITSPGPSTLAGSPAAASTPAPASGTSSYIFDPNRSDLNVVYYSQSPVTPSVPFMNVCNDSSVDIIILSFVTDFFTAGGYPTLNLASKCWGLDPNTPLGAAAKAKGASGLIDCISPGFAAQVAQCQATGKKVMISLGGSKDYSNTAIPSPQKAAELAHTLWSLFLGGTDPNITPLRPFGGNVVLDGIDIDNENPANAAYIPILASNLRGLFQTSHAAGSKPFYLSAAPQCPRPDLSIPVPSMLPNLDFVSVQFYNNPSCNLGTSGFIDSLKLWSSDVANYASFHNVGNGLTAPRLLIGAPADPAAAVAGGYINQATWQTTLQQVKALRLANLGGAMFWDGSYLELSRTGGQTFADVVRNVL